MVDYPMVLYDIPTKDRILIKNSHKNKNKLYMKYYAHQGEGAIRPTRKMSSKCVILLGLG